MTDRGPQLAPLVAPTPLRQSGAIGKYLGQAYTGGMGPFGPLVSSVGQIWPRVNQTTSQINDTRAITDALGVLPTLSSKIVVTSVHYGAACRLRVYQTAAARTADASRSVYVPPPSGVGLLYEYVAMGVEADNIPWVGWYASGEAQLYYLVDGGPATILLTWKGI